ncbi:hypothetical protein [Shewanella sp. SW24]|uniref:hypothetical protein n=1 Tax=Shewanella sp. SW24 TaxID=2912815 RepID=UPI0021D9ADF1|nr:hypothetical protein [Shewanella sp. SW24]MCU7985595.1 hypothetical protein [Shewanella sp. SW24]
MAEVIFRYINGVLRPITVSKVMAGQAASGQMSHRRQVPRQTLAAGHYRAAEAFTVPNATCQVCGEKVFYYEHPNGARVLFDELGPPWPKHPCYEAGQVGKSATGLKKPDRNKQKNVRGKHSPNWQKLGWLPLVYEKEVLQQSGKSLRVQARANHLEVRFEIPLIKQQQQGIAQSKVKDLLMLAKVEGHGVSVQLHDGLTAMTFHGVLTDKEAENTDKSTIKPRMLPLNQKQLQSLTKLDGPVRCNQDNDCYIELMHSFHSYTVIVKEKAFQHLIPSIKSLEAWISKPTKKGNQVVYILDRMSRQFVSAVIPASAFSEQMYSQPRSTRPEDFARVGMELLQNINILPDTVTTKIVSGKLGDRDIQLIVPNRFFRLGELPEHFTAGTLQILLQAVCENIPSSDKGHSAYQDQTISHYWLYILNTDEKIPKTSRGIVSYWQAKPSDSVLIRNVVSSPPDSHPLIVINKKNRINVRPISVDLTESEKIVIEVADTQMVHRLRLHSISDKAMLSLEKLIHHPENCKVYLVPCSKHSYQLHVNNRFVVLATEISVFKQTSMQNLNSTSLVKENMSIAGMIKGNSHLDSHTLGAALLDAITPTVKTDDETTE